MNSSPSNGMRRQSDALALFKKRRQKMQAAPAAPLGATPPQVAPMGLNRTVAAPPLKYGAP